MSVEQTAQGVFAAIEARDFDRALSLLTDDFTFSGATPVPLNKHQWIGVHRALGAAMPDFSFGYQLVKAQGDHVSSSVSLTGTHTQELVLPMPEFPRVAATGNKIALPKERIELSIKGNQVSALAVESVPDGGLLGILKQMGVAVPHP